MSNSFDFQGVGEHDFRPSDSLANQERAADEWLECVYCGTEVAHEAEGIVGAMFDCYQEQLLRNKGSEDERGHVRDRFTGSQGRSS